MIRFLNAALRPSHERAAATTGERILPPQEADRLVAALNTHRDRAMVLGMLLAGLRRCEVLGLRFEDVRVADRRLARRPDRPLRTIMNC